MNFSICLNILQLIAIGFLLTYYLTELSLTNELTDSRDYFSDMYDYAIDFGNKTKQRLEMNNELDK